ncbi:hypothetical protein [Streptomyces sp. NPDC005969]|uniref:hypothetical protein n=1 Tax=Streptomyces sp. NPDC005969 TaxID=3156722 RepID=UPI00340C6E3E
MRRRPPMNPGIEVQDVIGVEDVGGLEGVGPRAALAGDGRRVRLLVRPCVVEHLTHRPPVARDCRVPSPGQNAHAAARRYM